MKKTIVIYSPSVFSKEIWLPTLWSQAKTYYERNGKKADEWYWAPCYADIWANDFEKCKEEFLKNKPDVFAVSLYVWNYQLGHQAAKWIKETWPECLVITGGPHQYFKYNENWFKEHPYIDASLPGDCYGELCIQEILDNLNEDNKINFNLVSNIVYAKGKSKVKLQSCQILDNSKKKDFDYQWTSFFDQKNSILDFINYHKKNIPESRTLAVFETTRGCPYGCTYCDWGGGISSTVIKKDFNIILKDIEFLCSIDLKYLYIADANLGIFGERDVNIIKSISKFRKQKISNVKIGYGGFAKTDNKVKYIKQIIDIDLKNKLSSSDEIKLSFQSLDKQVLKNINRVNLDFNTLISVLSPLSKKSKLPMYGEMILGLPGYTLTKFYNELTVLQDNDLSGFWYEWLILPETPSYNPEYREKFKIVSTIRKNGWAYKEPNSNKEVVIETSTYSKNDYLQMLLSSSLYYAIVNGGLYKNTLKWIKLHKKIGIGDIIKLTYEDFFVSRCSNFYKSVTAQWQNIVNNTNLICEIEIDNNKIYGGYYFIALSFLKYFEFVIPLGSWLKEKYNVPNFLITKDQNLIKHSLNSQKTLDQTMTDFLLYRNSGQCLLKTTMIDKLLNLVKL